jgi:hypothetical protein
MKRKNAPLLGFVYSKKLTHDLLNVVWRMKEEKMIFLLENWTTRRMWMDSRRIKKIPISITTYSTLELKFINRFPVSLYNLVNKASFSFIFPNVVVNPPRLAFENINPRFFTRGLLLAPFYFYSRLV